MSRFILVCLFVLTSLAAWAPSVAAEGSDNLPNAPQAKSGGLEFSIEKVIRGDDFGAPINFDKDEEGRTYVLMSIRVSNTGDSETKVDSSHFSFVNGEELIGSSGDTSERAAKALTMKAMGDSGGYQLRPGAEQVFVVGWRFSVDLDKLTLNIDYDGAKRIDLTAWLKQNTKPSGFRPADIAPFLTRDGSFEIGDTLGGAANDVQFTATGYQYLDGIDLGFEYLQPRGKFVLVSFTLYVGGRESRTFTLDSVHLYSGSTDQFTDYNSEATIFYNDVGNSLTFEDLQPGLTYDGNAVFDVSLEGADFWLTVGGDTDDPLSAIHLDSAATTGRSDGASAGEQPVTDCSAFADYDEAQAYYADTPEAQPYIDPDFDGQACEVFFGRG